MRGGSWRVEASDPLPGGDRMETSWRRKRGAVASAAVAAVAVTAWLLLPADRAVSRPDGSAEMVVYKGPACGCCEAWIEHVEDAGFTVRVEDRSDLYRLKRRLGVPSSAFSCHTAVVSEKVIEGHVPASALRRYLRAEAPGEGLAVPGMPTGSPGMGAPHPGSSFDVFVFDRSGRLTVFERR